VLTIAAQYPELNIGAALNLFLATRSFRAEVSTVRDVFIAGETFDVTVTTTDAAAKKTAEKMTLAVIERTEVQGQVGEKTGQEHKVATEKESGQGRGGKHHHIRAPRPGGGQADQERADPPHPGAMLGREDVMSAEVVHVGQSSAGFGAVSEPPGGLR